ncbi:MAG: metal ABC transporter solute-binding protein, Zn/Mn family, partial [Candidatus Methanospirareceae archaeon]
MRRQELIIGAFAVCVMCIIAYMGFSYRCCEGGVVSKDKIGVVVTIPPQAEFVEKIGGEKVKITVMVPSGASPHTYEPTPSQLKEVSEAKIYFKVGSGVEFEKAWMDKIIAINPDMLVIDTSQGIEL